jgi:DNA topoisomerase-1
MAKPLVIVESPAKAKTLSRFLGSKYRVEASFGHIRDLPERASEVPESIKDKSWGRMAVDVDGDFTPYYVIPADKKRHITQLKAALKDASEVFLATDPDREGESISWHLKEVLKPKVPVRRIVFHEITEDAVNEAIKDAHDVDENLVRAQESRRILDRLYGYTLSPVLWKKVQTGLSAGRVQSVAVRLIVEREEERRRFKSASFWDLDARLQRDGREFTATLVRLGNDRLASGKDFDPATGALKDDKVRLLKQQDAVTLAQTLQQRLPWAVTNVEERPTTQRPAPPFTTSTLQQEANRKLGFSADRTMSVAQRLFQGLEIGGGEIEGLITYHRTDSTTLSQKALGEAERYIKSEFGDTYYSGPRQYQTKVRNAQEAHEAIRPTDFRQTPAKLAGVLDSDEVRLYELIWKRTIASQMADARLLRTTVEITATTADNTKAVFTASGKAIQFPGFLRAYVEGSDDAAADLGDQETILPKCEVGDQVIAPGSQQARALTLNALDPKGHETTPPARFTEASLVKRLEEDGIGRPSTYAPTIDTIKRRGYVFQQGKAARAALVPSFTAFAVTTLLRDHFSDYVDTGFTAEVERDLDQISEGQREWIHFLREFYRGGGQNGVGLEQKVQQDENINYPAVDLGLDPATNEPVRIRIGRYGPFVQRGEGGTGNTASIPDDVAPADFTVEQAVGLLTAKAQGPRSLGADPATGQAIYLMSGRFGAYVQLGETPEKEKGAKAVKPKRASIPSNMSEATLTLAEALKLLSLPREVGKHPADGEQIVANFGRFGPYIKYKDEFRSLESEDRVFTVTLDEAVTMLAQPKKGRQRQATRTVLAALGAHPGSGAQVQLLAGRYGPYVTDGTTNASLPKGADPAKLTMEEAVELLKAREGVAPKKGGARGRGGARKAPARKSTARKKVAAAS